MKQFLSVILLCFCFCALKISAQKHYKPVRFNKNSVVKDQAGNSIAYKDVMTMMMSGEWKLLQKLDSNDNSYFVLKKNTDIDKKRLKKLLQRRSLSSEYKGKKAPSFTSTDIEGNRISTETVKDKVVVLNFWFTTCKPCVAEIPDLNKVYEKYKHNDDVVFAAITFNTYKNVAKFLEKYPIAYPVVTDDKKTITSFEVNSYPTNMVIDRNGKIVNSISGGIPNIGEFIEKMIDTALQEE